MLHDQVLQWQRRNKMAENNAIVNGIDLPISTKHSVEICNLIRNKSVKRAKELLENTINMKQAIPYKRFKRDLAHRRGKMAEGRFPVKTSKEILSLIKSVEANAKNKNLDINNLIIKKAIANKAGNQFHSGRQRRIKMKKTHLTIMVEEANKENKK